MAVAGKTGTSQKFDFARRVYSSERVKTSFMGFFPSENPQVAILVILDEPQRDKWGGVAAAPVFREIGEQILTRFRTNIRTPGRGETQPDEGATCPRPHGLAVQRRRKDDALVPVRGCRSARSP
jgi:cell division protein FtsI (penicillin-binding protein 3)